MEIRKISAGRNSLLHLFKDKTGVEVGTERGKYAEKVASVCDKLYCVDLWRNYEGYREHVDQILYDDIYAEAKKRLSKYNCELIREESMTASMRFQNESLDFLYLDSNHQYLFVVHDLLAWVPKIKPGGIVSGHDYRKTKDFGVIQAVNEYCISHGIDELTVWAGDKTPSWSFIVPDKMKNLREEVFNDERELLEKRVTIDVNTYDLKTVDILKI